MGDPRNPARAGELWDLTKIAVLEAEVRGLSPTYCAISGGWAWHFMSPEHQELKLHHDHKDIDVFVRPLDVPRLLDYLRIRGYTRVWTKYDRTSKDFYRYERVITFEERPIKVLLDIFVEAVPTVLVNGVQIVEPQHLLTLYSGRHSTDDCTAVKAARKLVAQKINPIGRPELVGR